MKNMHTRLQKYLDLSKLFGIVIILYADFSSQQGHLFNYDHSRIIYNSQHLEAT